MQSLLPSPAVAIVGRHNSGKTTLIEQLIATMTKRGLDVGSIKHHSHVGFSIDIPGKDSYRHRAAGATETIISAPGQMAVVRDMEGEAECSELVERMPGHDIVIVEGYRKSGLPTIEVMRAANQADVRVAEAFARASLEGAPLGTDFVQAARRELHDENPVDHTRKASDHTDISNKMPAQSTVAVVTDIPLAQEAAARYGILAFALDDIDGIADFLQQRFTRSRLSVVIQAGGESRRMGRSKATVPFAGRPLIMRMVEQMLPVADELVITTNEPENLEFLFEAYPHASIRLVRDVKDERGALPGLLTALQAASCPIAAIIACDMVFASPRLVVAECAEMEASGADVVVPVNKHGYEPFHALYRCATCLPVVRAAVEAGEKRMQVVYPQLDIDEFPQARVLEAEPRGGCFINANTPEELHIIEQDYLGE
jgi:molybdopterin-guanine dinucleotide biosynthesis protein MobB